MLVISFRWTLVDTRLNPRITSKIRLRSLSSGFFDWNFNRERGHEIIISQPVYVKNLSSIGGHESVSVSVATRSNWQLLRPPGTPANQLGIYTSGLVGNSYVLPRGASALQSTAAAVVD